MWQRSVAELSEEVAVLLRHQNLDPRIEEWLWLAYNDITSRVPSQMFNGYASNTIASGNWYADLEGSGLTATRLGAPVAAVMWNAGDLKARTPRYLSPNDWSRVFHRSDGVVIQGSLPEVWTLQGYPMRAGGMTVDEGRQYFYVYPQLTATYTFLLFLAGRYQLHRPTGSQYYDLPACWEHVLVFGAASIGAMAARPELAALYQMEYEEAIRDMLLFISYFPDAHFTRRDVVGGEYAGTPRMMAPPRFPSNI